jgi:uncharacterized protein (UPF0332 family)/predicted nucleotidyltransferase
MKNIGENKKLALSYFLKKLFVNGGQKLIGSIYLFGSFAKGKFKQDSDIDLLVFALDELEKVRSICAQISFDTAVEFGESIEPLVYCIDEARFIRSNFILSVLKRGREIYKMKERDLVKKEAENYLNLAKDYLEQSKNSFKANDMRLAVDGAYNSCELAVKGLLLLKTKELPRTHGGIVQKFGQLYIKTKILSQDLGRELNLSLDLRNRARYDFHAQVISGGVKKVIKLAKDLIKHLEKNLK